MKLIFASSLLAANGGKVTDVLNPHIDADVQTYIAPVTRNREIDGLTVDTLLEWATKDKHDSVAVTKEDFIDIAELMGETIFARPYTEADLNAAIEHFFDALEWAKKKIEEANKNAVWWRK